MPHSSSSAGDRAFTKARPLLHGGGLGLLALGFVLAAVLDPMGQTGGTWRWVQGLSFASGLLLLTLVTVLPSAPKTDLRRLLPPLLGGTVLALGGVALSAGMREMALLAAVGAGLQAWVLGQLMADTREPRVRVLMAVLLFGLVLDIGAGVAASGLFPGLQLWLGPETSLRLRLLRLARAAAGALPLLSQLSEDLAVPGCRWSALGRRALVFGAVAMPVCLVAAAGKPLLKYLLPLPADALVVGVLIATAAAWKRGWRLEGLGWTLVLGSMAVGLLMGLYSFEGPLRPPALLGGYSAPARTMLRLGHSYCVVLGLGLICAARVRWVALGVRW